MAITDSEERARLRRRLDEREAALRPDVQRQRAEEARPAGTTAGGNVEDSGELGEEHTRDAVRNVEQRRDTQELRDIDDARRRMDEGGYGDCVDCGVEIPLARLQANPAAARCIDCQERFERAHPALPAVPLPGVRSAPADAPQEAPPT